MLAGIAQSHRKRQREPAARTVAADNDLIRGDTLLPQPAPRRKRIVIGGGERVLRRKPKSDRQRTHAAGAARLRHHPSMTDDGAGAIAAAVEEQQDARTDRCRARSRIRPGTPSRSTASSTTSPATGQIEPTSSRRLRRSSQPTGRGLEPSSCADGVDFGHALPSGRGSYRPVRASECTQPCMRDLALAMSSLVKNFAGFTLSIG